ncbi:MAG TPA: crosslink repair DNA glycosylase YcaQ family protein, partial [Anaerolineae bacterium]|nr:crosslink repair DNA glycosylase YcaQ family protein [Anaerolineae bacterium]
MDVLQVVEDIGALHASAATTPYLTLWSRMETFNRQQLDVELYEKRTLVRLLCMRYTMHIVPSQRMPAVFQALGALLQERHLRQIHQLLVWAGLCQEGDEPETLRRLEAQVEEALADGLPRTVSELGQVVPELKAQMSYSPGRPYAGRLSVGSRLVPGMCILGALARVQPRGTWRSNQHRYTPLATWLPDVNLDAVTAEHAQASLVRGYLAAFGPSTLEDIIWWSG